MIAAKALQDVLDKKKKPVIFNNERYIEFEDWQTLARFYGYSVQVRSTNFVDYGSAKGFEATADVLKVDTGQIVSSADAMCLNDEENWGARSKYEWKEVLDDNGRKVYDKSLWGGKGGYVKEKVLVGETPVPLFQLRSMAQTRACAKAFRNVLAWVVVLAGYRPTPAEEMGNPDRGSSEPPPPFDEPPTSKGKPPAKAAPKAAQTEKVMCSQCQGMNGHTADCPTQNKQQAPQDKGKLTRLLYVDKLTPAKSKTGTPYLTAECTDRDQRVVTIYCYHGHVLKHADTWLNKWCEFNLSEKPSKDGKKLFLSVEEILNAQSETESIKYQNSAPVTDQPAGDELGFGPPPEEQQ